MSKLFSNSKVRIGVSIACLALIVGGGVGLGIGNDLAFNRYATVISHHLCPNGDSSSDSAQAARNMGNELAREIEREGIVMLKNEDNTLPLSKDISKVNVFGHGSIDWYIMSSGSEMVGTDGQTSYGILEALEHYGVETNKDLSNFYKSWHKAEGDANTIFTGLDTFYQIREPSLEEQTDYQALYEEAKAFSDTAFFVVSRHAGENSDCPHYQTKYKPDGKTTVTDNSRSYLEISTEEEYAIRKLGQDFENVVIIINSTNTMMLDYLESIEGIDACISVGVTGVQGALSIPEILWGDASPSGHLTDTIPYKFEDNITYFRGNAKHTHQYTGAPSSCTTMGAGGSAFYRNSVYVEYTEGIYIGYRWFETADAEGFWDQDPYEGYDSVVQFPFGFGMSYTTFDWELKDQSKADGDSFTENETMTLTVTVTNTGSVAGKDVVEVYLTAPYYTGEIEKSAVKLVAYAKSPELKPGQTADVEIEVDTKEFKSYDDYDANNNDFCGYELDAGEYQLKLMTDAHHMKDMKKNTVTLNLNEGIQITEDDKTGNTVENRFTGENAYMGIPIDGSTVGQDIHYVHRNDFPALLTEVEPDKPWDARLLERTLVDGDTTQKITVSNSCWNQEIFAFWDNATYDYFGNPVNQTKPVWGSKDTNHLLLNPEDGKLSELGFELANNFEDERWEEVLNQIPYDHARHISTMDTQYKAPGIAAIGLRTNDDGAFQHAEGASQVGNGVMAPGTSCVGYPGSTVLAQTWNQVLAFMYGKSEGNDMGPAGKDCLYSPACNVHRSPFGGRNSGYQSEDPYLSGRVVGNLIRGLGVYGKTSHVKHFALNDQDFNRMGLYTWTTEQALREIYIRTFEEAIKYGDSTGVMTSFNRCGAIWAGGNEALMQGILRYEWGFKGQIITDMTENETNMDGSANIRAGGNINLGGFGGVYSSGNALQESSSTGRIQNRMRESMHEIAYAMIHAQYKNETYNASVEPSEAVVVFESKQAWIWWKPGLVAIDAIVYGGLAILAYLVVTKWLLVDVLEAKGMKEEQ